MSDTTMPSDEELRNWYKKTCDFGSSLDRNDGTIGAIESKREFAELKAIFATALHKAEVRGQNKILNIGTGSAEGLTSVNMGEVSDGYHTFNELYSFHMAYNALLFNEWAAQNKYGVHKSWKHADGKDCFDGGWFVVSAQTPQGQITNHYEKKDWQLFNVPYRKTAVEWDGHTPQEALKRLLRLAATLSAERKEEV